MWVSLRSSGAAVGNFVIVQGSDILGITRTLVISGTLFFQDPCLMYVSLAGEGRCQLSLK